MSWLWLVPIYRSLAKKHSHLKKHQPFAFGLSFPYRVKVYCNEHPPWSKLCVANQAHSQRFEKQSHNTLEVRNFMLCFTKCVYKVVDIDNAAVLTVHLAHGDMLPFRVLCAITEDLTLKGWQLHCILQFVHFFAVNWFKGIESLWTWQGCSFLVKWETTCKSAQPLLVRCFIYGCSFMRLQYIMFALFDMKCCIGIAVPLNFWVSWNKLCCKAWHLLCACEYICAVILISLLFFTRVFFFCTFWWIPLS